MPEPQPHAPEPEGLLRDLGERTIFRADVVDASRVDRDIVGLVVGQLGEGHRCAAQTGPARDGHRSR